MAKKISRGEVELVQLHPDQFHADTMNAQVKQVVEITYDYSRGPFVQGNSDPIVSNRYAFVPVPADWDEAKVSAAIKGGTIRRTLGCIPQSVMSENQRQRLASMSGPEKDDLLNRILNRITSVDGTTGEVILYKGEFATYGRNEFVLGKVDDIDLRDQDVATLSVQMDEVIAIDAEIDAPDPVFTGQVAG